MSEERANEFEALIWRMGCWILATAAVSAVGVGIYWGWKDAAGFVLGSIGAYLNMRWLAAGLKTPDGPAAGMLVLRFVLLAGASYVILETFGIRPLSILAGLLTAPVAAVLEVLFQLFYART